MSTISNEDFLIALNNNDNQGIMRKVMSRFRKIVKDEALLYQLAQIGLFKCLRDYDGVGCKFTTFLYKSVTWEILTHLRTNKVKLKTVSLHEVGDIPRMFVCKEDVLDSLSDYEKSILHKRDTENRTLLEIANEYNSCVETVRRHLVKVYDKIRDDYCK